MRRPLCPAPVPALAPAAPLAPVASAAPAALGAAALLFAAALLPAAAWAKSCLGKRADGWDDPRTFALLRDCQAHQRHAFIAAVKAKTGKAPGAAQLERFDDSQRAEVTTYMGRHTIDGDASSSGDDAQAQAPAARTRARTGTGSPPADASDAAGGAAAGEAGATPADMAFLKSEMLEKSDNGKKGMTPELAGELRQYLMNKQGSVSPDMQKLLDSTARDGVKLTPDTMNQLRNAAKAAKGQGMQLGIDPSVEKELLEGDITPAAGQGQPGTN